MWDHSTGRSKGYGFVSMRTKEDAGAAIEQMHGQVGGREIRDLA
jgi:nucleolysin TIA-1/TIAR